jgi:arylamine N-acetyltransferase
LSPLDPALVRRILARFGVGVAPPSVELLDSLIAAYTRLVPWESAFRIARRARTTDPAARPRWPAEFWQDALDRGGGGTCFESNYAFFTLLQTVGYEGNLTINNMGDRVGCHTAIILKIERERWLVDVGIPLYVSIPVDPNAPARRTSPFHVYTLSPAGTGSFEVVRDNHPSPYVYTLIDRPVDDQAFRAAITADYGENGLFLDRLIITKVIQGQQWRFNSGDPPFHLEKFVNGRRTNYPLVGDIPAAIANHFEMDVDVVRIAFTAVA